MKCRIYACIISIIMLAVLLLSACGGDTPEEGTVPSPTEPAAQEEVPDEVAVAGRMAAMFSNLIVVDNYYADGVSGMAGVDTLPARASNVMRTAFVLTATTGSLDNVPPEFLEKLPPDGRIPAPPGACQS